MVDDSNCQPDAVEEAEALHAVHRIKIEASPETVWAVLSDLEGWSRWNTIYTPPVCLPEVGEKVSGSVTMPGASPTPFSAEIIAWEPNKRFSWYSAVMDGQMQMTRYMEIDEISPERCAFTNGEAFGGTMGPAIMKGKVDSIANGFRLMNEALKKEAEAR